MFVFLEALDEETISDFKKFKTDFETALFKYKEYLIKKNNIKSLLYHRNGDIWIEDNGVKEVIARYWEE